MQTDDYAKNFRDQSMPAELAKLLAFDQQVEDFYSEGFELGSYGPDELSTWSEEEGFLSRLIPFAQATGGGSVYALWLHPAGVPLSEAPVVVFGDEGGVHIVAKNLRALLEILSFDTEPSIDWDEVYYYKSDDHEPSERADDYARWLQAEFGLAPVSDADALVSAAQQEHKQAFDAWVQQFVSS